MAGGGVPRKKQNLAVREKMGILGLTGYPESCYFFQTHGTRHEAPVLF